ncbi:MAG: hypothetical protein HUU22_01460 [Phycisphaerae bacterium]|nr:hypothetical protein [Phycisphaerae bacterium]NUQ44683.1 hypothetical protein [Phycisphaerae bacterium]
MAIHVPSADRNTLADHAIAVRFDPATDAHLARYGLEHVLSILGLRASIGDWSEPTIYRGDDPRIGRRAAIWIVPFTEPPHGRVPAHADAPIHCPDAQPTRRFDSSVFDFPRAAARWLTLDAERRIAARDAYGRVRAAHSELARLAALHDPPVANYAAMLKGLIEAAGARVRPRPVWPAGKRFAVALTHDVDQPERPLRLAAALRSLKRTAGHAAKAIGHDRGPSRLPTRFWSRLMLPPTARSDWDFDTWLDVEAACGLRSAFYFAATTRRNRHGLDPDYEISRRRYRALFSKLESQGWEVGLHAAYDSINGRPPVALQCARWSQSAGRPATGVRHHFLNVRHDDPIDTLRTHADAGLSYDSSLGFNDAPGFRCGTAWPFRPFEAPGRHPRRFVELPLTLADMHLPADDVCTAVRIVMDHLQTVRRLGGLAVLDWHVGHWHTCPAWRESYRAACRWLAAQPDVWVAPPRDIAAWWLSNTE